FESKHPVPTHLRTQHVPGAGIGAPLDKGGSFETVDQLRTFVVVVPPLALGKSDQSLRPLSVLRRPDRGKHGDDNKDDDGHQDDASAFHGDFLSGKAWLSPLGRRTLRIRSLTLCSNHHAQPLRPTRTLTFRPGPHRTEGPSTNTRPTPFSRRGRHPSQGPRC